MKTQTKKQVSRIVICVILGLLVVATFFPYYFMLISSLKNNAEIIAHPFTVTRPFRFENYTSSFGMIANYLKNSVIVSGASVLGTMILGVISAYVFAVFDFPGKNFFYMFILSFMMIPSVLTLIPQYVLVSDMKMIGTFWAVILPSIATAQIQFIVILRPFIESLPHDLFDAAKLDGANAWTILWRIMAPLVKPTVAVITLYYAVSHWNSWFNAMMFLRDKTQYPLQLILRQILIQNDTADMTAGADYLVSETIQYATVVVATLPILCIYPFVQKYFVKGVMIGAIKG